MGRLAQGHDPLHETRRMMCSSQQEGMLAVGVLGEGSNVVRVYPRDREVTNTVGGRGLEDGGGSWREVNEAGPDHAGSLKSH